MAITCHLTSTMPPAFLSHALAIRIFIEGEMLCCLLFQCPSYLRSDSLRGNLQEGVKVFPFITVVFGEPK